MSRYEFLRRVAKILAPQNAEALFDYIIHSMDDDGGFLRSRYCYWNKVLPDYEEKNEQQIVLAALARPFNFNDETNYYEDEEGETKYTYLKMQLLLVDLSDDDEFYSAGEWSAAVGFPYPIKIDMTYDRYEVLPKYK
ncbi:MAG: hypothetical protein ACK5LL_00040 [Suipraeoptans sp.]